MTTFCRLALFAMLAWAGTELRAQDFSQFKAGPASQLDGVAKAVYSSLSDMEDAGAIQQAAFQSLGDGSPHQKSLGAKAPSAATATARLSDAAATARLSDGVQQIPTTEVAIAAAPQVGALGAIGQTSLLGAGCGLPCGPACGLPGGCAPDCSAPVCGLPSDPACGLPAEAACGLPAPSCGNGGGFLSGLLGGGCDAGGCDDGCDSCGGGGQLMCGSLCTRKCPDCCGVGTHYSYVYGDFLFMRARKSEVTYAVPSNGPIVPGAIPIQVGNFGVIDSDYDVGFRAGVNLALDTVSSLNARYTYWSNDEYDEVSLAAPNALESMISHPATISTASTALAAEADYYLDLQYIDVDYRHLLKCCEVFSANYVIGGRYASLEQGLDVDFLKQPTESIWTDIDFEGGGIRLGLETQRFSCRNQLHVYANGYASFLAGRFRAHYLQGTSVDPVIVDTNWEAGRLVPILDFEAGVGWNSRNGKLRLNAGYMASAWFNTMTTQSWIEGIQANDFSDVCKSLWFDGLQARVSFCF